MLIGQSWAAISVSFIFCLYIIKRISAPFISFNKGDFALVAKVRAWAAAAVGTFVLPFLATFRCAL